MLLPFTINPPANPASGDPPSDPVPTPRTDEPFLLSLTESNRPPAPAGLDGDHLRAVFAASPMAIVALDQTGIVTLWNPAAAAMFGWTGAEAVGATAPPEFMELSQHAYEGETITSVPARPRAKDGTELDVRVSFAPLRNTKGDVYGVIAIFAPAT